MDILRPPTVWIDGRCYRTITPVVSSTSNYAEEDSYADDPYNDDVNCGMEEDVDNFQIEKLLNGKCRTSLAVANVYHSYLIGSRGATKKRIESETYTQIKFPNRGQGGDVEIIGKDVKTVRQARIKLELLVAQARRKQAFTHFLCIPFNKPNIQEKFIEFKEKVLETCGGCREVTKDLFQNPTHLHLTITVLTLVDDREREEACENLMEWKRSELALSEPMRVELRGIEYMNDDPGCVHVLYAKVNPLSWADSLQELANSLLNRFVKAGLVNCQYERVKLHVTVMNSKFVVDRDDSCNPDEKVDKTERESFDARQIIEEYGEFYFGELEVNEIHMSLRYSSTSDRFYTATSKITLEC
ncbi:activating signal cointegrator 1 complex subunit 1 [Oratosquilla oratoria]|uniref:activating signal cointegrator 1 complex subunit 1 n=1 Tax=Oratosquilla oratoria TaxID=337810 RepID=UPI003F777C38